MVQPAHQRWRVVLLTDYGDGVVTLMRQILPAHGHKLVGILTSPGPKGRGHGRHVDVVKAAPRGVDVIVSNYPRRWAAMLAPMRPDLIISAVFPLDHSGRRHRPAAPRHDQHAWWPAAGGARSEQLRLGDAQG